MTYKPFTCTICPKSFADENGRWQHARKKHKGMRIRDMKPAPAEREESYGELFARAAWDDDPELDFIREMMP